MRRGILKVCSILMAVTLFFLLSARALPVSAAAPQLVKLERTVDTTNTIVGQQVTINYKITGDDIVIQTPKEIALVIDVSGSMDWGLDGKTNAATASKRITILKGAVNNFINQFTDKDVKICIVPFSTNATSEPTMYSMQNSTQRTTLINAVNNLSPNGNTNLGDGMRVARNKLNSSTDTTSKKYIVTLTDGDPNQYLYTTTGSTRNYYTGLGIYGSSSYSNIKSSADSNGLTGLAYAKQIGGNIFNNSNFITPFLIGFATTTDLTTKLNDIGLSLGIARRSDGKRFYLASTATSLNDTYSAISQSILNDMPFAYAMFSETLPEGTIVDPAFRQVLLDKDFVIEDEIISGVTRTAISCPLEIVLTSSNAQTQTYRIKPIEFSIKIIFTTPGAKSFSASVNYIDYNDYKNVAGRVTSTSDLAVAVIQPVITVAIADSTVKLNNKITVRANVQPDNVSNRHVQNWRITRAVDSNGANVLAASIATFTVNADESIDVTGHGRGEVTFEVETVGQNSSGSTVRATGKVTVIQPVAAVTLDPAVVFVGEVNRFMSASVLPNDTPNKGVTNWVSSNSSIAEIDNTTGKIIAKSFGIAQISVDAAGKGDGGSTITGSCSVIVVNAFGSASIDVSQNSNQLNITKQVPSSSDEQYMTFSNWRSENTNLITVDATGNIKGINPTGSTPVKVFVDVAFNNGTVSSSKTIACDVTVTNCVTGVNVHSTVVFVGESNRLMSADVLPSGTPTTGVTNWASNDNSIAQIDKLTGAITANSVGTVEISAVANGKDFSNNPVSGSKDIYVINADFKYPTVNLDLFTEDKLLELNKEPSDIDEDKITFSGWSSSDPNVTVTDGKVTVKGKPTGLVTISAKANYDDAGYGYGSVHAEKTISCTINVTNLIDIN